MSPRTPPGGTPAGDPETATADEPASYEEAVRRAFQSADSIEPARIAPRRPPGTASADSTATASAGSAPAASSTPAPSAPADAVDGDPLAIPEAAAEASMAGAADPVPWVAVGPGAGGTIPAGPLPAPGPFPALGPSPAATPPDAAPRAVVGQPAAAPSSRGARLPRPEAREDLLHVPESVASTADDFFGGLVRRVERRR